MVLQRVVRQSCPLLSSASKSIPPEVSRTSIPRSIQARLAHSVPPVRRYDEEFKEHGVPDLFSPTGYDTAWTQYQTHVVDRLNTLLAGNPLEHASVKDIAINTAREPSLAPLFNYASMAHNNHFFFESLSPTTTDIPLDLAPSLVNSFSSIDTLRATLLTTASAMFGPGFVWLVQDNRPAPATPSVQFTSNMLHFRILTTYLAGSPYPGAHMRQQPLDMNSVNLASNPEEWERLNKVQNSVGSFGRYSGENAASLGGSVSNATGMADGWDGDPARFGGADIVPVLCVNTWEHAWLPDWGVKGKRDYLERWWERIDWAEVWRRCDNRPGNRWRR